SDLPPEPADWGGTRLPHSPLCNYPNNRPTLSISSHAPWAANLGLLRRRRRRSPSRGQHLRDLLAPHRGLALAGLLVDVTGGAGRYQRGSGPFPLLRRFGLREPVDLRAHAPILG